MLLVGSRAAKLHFASFRAPRDWDVFATREELARVRSLGLTELPSAWAKKARFEYQGTILEVGIADEGTTNRALFAETRGTKALPIVGEVDVASPEALLFLKRSHLPFMIHWAKSLDDVRFLRRYAALGERWMPLLERRFVETKEQLLPEQCTFPKRRGQVCAPAPEGAYLHTQLHELVKRGRRPARAALASHGGAIDSFALLPRADKLAVLAEEAMAIALERFFLGAPPGARPPAEHAALLAAYQQMVLFVLSLELRDFAVEAIDEAIAMAPKGFSRDLARRLDARLPIANQLSGRPISVADFLPHHPA